jgi:hypothetical protein
MVYIMLYLYRASCHQHSGATMLPHEHAPPGTRGLNEPKARRSALKAPQEPNQAELREKRKKTICTGGRTMPN